MHAALRNAESGWNGHYKSENPLEPLRTWMFRSLVATHPVATNGSTAQSQDGTKCLRCAWA